jgi:hypothetical protein
VRSALLTLLAGGLVWFALTAPDRTAELTPAAFARIPLEALVLAVLVLALPRARRPVAVAAGLLLGVVALLRLLDLAFSETLDRPFDTVVDWGYLGPLTGLVVDSVGRTAGVGVLAAVGLLVLVLLLAMPWALLRLSRVALRHRRTSWRVVGAVAVAWLVTALLGLSVVGSEPVASTSAASYAVGQVTRIPAEIRDQRRFERATRHDPLASAPADSLLTGLRGKDVLVVFVESYGRVAVEGSSFSPGVDAVLDRGTRRLRADGFGSRSAFLTSPTFGGISWLAHSTLQSGLWVDSQRRYDVLLRSRRATLTQAFGRAGWRTVSDVPAITSDWPQGRFYGYDTFYDSRTVGYAGPRFGYPTMPDQFTLDAFHRLELARHPRRPVMAEIDLVTSHAPWSRIPRLVAQRRVGDGSVFDGMPQRLPSKSVVWRSSSRIKRAYGQSVAYSLRSLVSFVHAYGDKDLVLVVLGDHQPATVVSGRDAGHDVPVTVVARDPAVTRRFADWGWQPGLRPRADAPVWRMDRFRDRFLAGFGSGSH